MSSNTASPFQPSMDEFSQLQHPTLPIPKKSALIKTDRPRPHVCSTCTRAFARLEHLKRHERSHTNEKPFQCAACGRCFARRDLVLRHQLKLHASLPSSNRARLRKHNFDHDVQEGDVVQDYLNDNINVIYKNTNAKLPLPASDSKLETPPEDLDHDILPPTQMQKKAKLLKRKLKSMPRQNESNIMASNPSSLDASPQFIGTNFTTDQQQYHAKQELSPITSNTSPPDKNITYNNINDDFLQNATPLSFTPQAMTASMSERAPTIYEEQGSNNKTRNRHSSFSAASLSSYTLLKDAQDIQKHDIPEAPHQIGFATPQLSAQELADRALLAGFDLDALGIDPNNLQKNDENVEKVDGYFVNEHSAGDTANNPGNNNRVSTPFEFNMTPGGSLLDMPLLQQYLHVGGAGGGAGFESSSFKFNPENKVAGVHSELGKDNEEKNEWLSEFINTPFDLNFSTASHHIGFTDSPPRANEDVNEKFSPTDIPSLFRSRQIDLFKQISEINDSSHNSETKLPKFSSMFFFTPELRKSILTTYNLQNNQFPLLEDLNTYMKFYELEFDKYFPFIHLPTVESHYNDNYLPLVLAMAAIGGLYCFQSSNSSILAKLSTFLIHSYMSSRKSSNDFHDIPLPIIQGLVLDIYLGMFGNELDINKTTCKHLHSVVGLVKSTQLNIGLENFILPPPVLNSYTNDDPEQLKNNYEYFILAQSRIRTVHVLYYLDVLFASLIGNDIELTSKDLQSGTPCHLEELWKASNCQEWSAVLKENRVEIDSKFTLIQLSNGESMKDILNDMEGHYSDKNLNFKTLLSALMSISEDIYRQRTDLQKEPNPLLRVTKWRMNSRPVIESLIKSWESIYVKNGGILVPRAANLHVINQTPVLKLILPLLSFAKVRKCIYFTPILSNIWSKNWEAMNQELKHLDADPEALRDGATYSLDILHLWVEIISISKDAEKTSIRTPIFFLTCIFAAILVIGEYLYATEIWARKYLAVNSASPSVHSSPLNNFNLLTPPPTLNAIDRVLWLKIQTLMKKVETNLSQPGSDSFENLNENISQLVLEPGIDLKHTAEIISMAKLSAKSLNVGVKILADAPVWPVALLFAELLKARWNFMEQEPAM